MLFNCAKTTNPAYHLLIKSHASGRPLEVVADMPETMSMSASSEWESTLPYNIFQTLLGNGSIASSMLARGAQAGGLNFIVQDLAYQTWTDSSPLELHMQLLLDAEDNAYLNVWAPLMLLSGLTLPIGGDATNTAQYSGLSDFVSSNLLFPPGPLNGDPNSEGAVQVFIGNQLFLLDCIMITGSPQWDSRLASDGYPISGQLDLTFRTSKIYGRQDWLHAAGVDRL